MPPPRKPRVLLSLGKTTEEVCRLCLPALGCREVGASEPCDLRWIVGEKDLETALQAEDHALVNKFPGMRELCHKAPFARLLARMAQLYPADYRFFPRTWVLPGDEVPCPGDFNGDGKVNGADLGLMLVDFGNKGSIADLNGDGRVDGADLGLLLSFWGDCP